MNPSSSLFLYEEIMLLALRNEKGTFATAYVEYAVAGAILAELLLEGRISLDDTRRKLVNMHNLRRTGDPIINECITKLKTAKRRASLATWLRRLARIGKLRHKVARQLCKRRIVRAREDTILLLFARRVYPEINPQPEKEIIERLRKAIFTSSKEIDPRTVVLVSLANGAGLLGQAFDRKKLRAQKKRIESIVKGEVIGGATKSVIEACQSATAVFPVHAVMGT